MRNHRSILRRWANRLAIPGTLLLLAMAILTGCKSAGPVETHSGHAGNQSLKLNGGKKWVVVQPMMVHIRHLESAVTSFPREGGDHRALASTIQENLGRLVTNCTMEGEAHDELHKWLIPFLALTSEYAEAPDLNAQKARYRDIQAALVAFNAHFE